MAEYGLYGAMVRHSLPLPPALLRAAGSCRKRPMHHSENSDEEADDSDGDHDERALKGSKDEKPGDGREESEKVDSGEESHKGHDSDEELMCPSEHLNHKDEDSNLEGTSWNEDQSEKSTEKLESSTIPSQSLVLHASEPHADLKTSQQELNSTSASKPGAEIADDEECKAPRKREGTEKEAKGDELGGDAIGMRTRWMLRMPRWDFQYTHSREFASSSFASYFHISRENQIGEVINCRLAICEKVISGTPFQA